MYTNLKKLGYYKKESKNVYFNEKEYRIVFPYYYTPCYPRYNKSLRKLEYFTCIKLYFNGINIREVINRIISDLNKVVNSIEVVVRLSQDIIKYFKTFYTLPSEKSRYTLKKTKTPKYVFILGQNENQSYKNQLVDLIFNEGNIDFMTLSIKENLERYKREVYDKLRVSGINLHKMEFSYYFKDGFLELLQYHLNNQIGDGNKYKFDFITLKIETNRLVVILKRDINKHVNYSYYVYDGIKDYIKYGLNELYAILNYYGIKKAVLLGNITARRLEKFHLAQKIGCDVEKDYPELLERLRLNQRNELESLAHIGLDNWSHCIDFSCGYWEHELHYNNKTDDSKEKIDQDLRLLERDKPKANMIDKYLNFNRDYTKEDKKFYLLLKGFLPIEEFSIEPNKSIKENTPLEYKCYDEINEFDILENELFRDTTKSISRNS